MIWKITDRWDFTARVANDKRERFKGKDILEDMFIHSCGGLDEEILHYNTCQQ